LATVDPTVADTPAAASGRSFTDALHEWVVTVDHKRLGLMYIVSGLFFLVVSGRWPP
jgi:cytochrome c oxidase subunit 1